VKFAVLAVVGVVGVTAACAANSAVQPQPGPSYADTAALLAEVRAVVEDFQTRLRGYGHSPGFVPEVVLNSESGLLYYEYAERLLVLPFWPDLSPAARDLYALIGGSAEEAEAAFNTINWFYLAHELAHYVIGEPSEQVSHYSNERAATAWAVAYWRARNETARLEYLRRLAASAAARMSSADPAPEASDRVAYFDRNYDALLTNPPAYGLYQLRMLNEVFAESPGPELEALARALPRS
jgi:hypothetical protein